MSLGQTQFEQACEQFRSELDQLANSNECAWRKRLLEEYNEFAKDCIQIDADGEYPHSNDLIIGITDIEKQFYEHNKRAGFVLGCYPGERAGGGASDWNDGLISCSGWHSANHLCKFALYDAHLACPGEKFPESTYWCGERYPQKLLADVRSEGRSLLGLE